MGKHVLIFKSSPREKGNSSILADKAAEGAKAAGAQVESFSLQRLNIQPCDACDTCQQTGVCVLKDDMQTLYPKLQEAEAMVIASPIYWFTMSAQAKLFIDRWYALESSQGNALKGRRDPRAWLCRRHRGSLSADPLLFFHRALLHISF